MYNVIIKRKIMRDAERLPERIQALLYRLVMDLEARGPEQPQWPNYSKLSQNTYHCHLGYRHVACWRNFNGEIEIEVYYVGSRENAPY